MREIDLFHDELECLGFRFSRQMFDTGVDWYAWRTPSGAVNCAHNNKAPSLIVTPYSHFLNGKAHQSAELSITAASDNAVWLQIKAYSFKLDEAIANLRKVERIIVAAWNAAAQEAIQPTEVKP